MHSPQPLPLFTCHDLLLLGFSLLIYFAKPNVTYKFLMLIIYVICMKFDWSFSALDILKFIFFLNDYSCFTFQRQAV